MQHMRTHGMISTGGYQKMNSDIYGLGVIILIYLPQKDMNI